MKRFDGLEKTIAKHLEIHHSGEGRAVSSRELERTFSISGPALRVIINHLRSEGVPICSFDYGYYYAETEQELQFTIRQLRSRIAKIATAERGLTKALDMYNDSGQIAFPLVEVER